METQHHRIGNLIFALDLTVSEGEQHAVLDRVRNLYLARVQPALDKLLGEVSSPEEVLRLDRLELDLGDLDGADWEEVFVARCLAQLRSSLRPKVTQLDGQKGERRLSLKDHALERVMNWLEEGRDSALPNATTLTATLSRLLTENGQALVLAVGDRAGSLRVMRRLGYGLPAETALELLAALAAAAPQARKVLEDLDQLAELSGGKPVAASTWARGLRALRMWVLAAHVGGQWPTAAQLPNEVLVLLHLLGWAEPATWDRVRKRKLFPELLLLLRMEVLVPGSVAWRRVGKSVGPDTGGGRLRRALALVAELREGRKAVAKEEGADATEGANRVPETALAEALRGAKPVDGASMAVPLAGLVLLHPFLRGLFGYLGWLEGSSFRDAEAQMLAVHALHWLGTGKEVEEEATLVIPKLLCGLPPGEAVDVQLALPEELRAACTEILAQVVVEWEGMRGTSADGLRESFLGRAGTLEEISSGWRLRVESMFMDVLLARLPWPVSFVALPWNPYLLFVEWG